MCVVFTSILVRNQGEMHDFLHPSLGEQMMECGNTGALQQKVIRLRKTQADKLR